MSRYLFVFMFTYCYSFCRTLGSFRLERWLEQVKMIADTGLTYLSIKIKSEYSLKHALSSGKEGHFPRGRGSRLRRNLERHQVTPSSLSKDRVFLWQFDCIFAVFLWHLWFMREGIASFTVSEGWAKGRERLANSPNDANIRLQNP